MSLIKLRSSDGQLLEVDARLAAESEVLEPRVPDYDGEPIPILQVTGRILALVIDYLDGNWDTAFVLSMGWDTIIDLVLAANYLNIKGLLDLTCQSMADMIRGMSPDEIRRCFNLNNGFTPEKEAEIRRENQWAFE